MPARPARPCTAPGCPALVTGTKGAKCPTHQRTTWREQNAHRCSASAQGYGAAWRALREHVLNDEPLCRECRAAGRITPAVELDHSAARLDGATDHLPNLSL